VISQNPGSWREFTFRTADGLSLFARDCGPEDGALTPLLCLPGLTRNSKDFEPLAQRLGEPRRMVAIDYRGRGRSDYSPDPKTYTPGHELRDAIALLDHLNIARACVVGTSRGGIVAMLMAAHHAKRMAGTVLNDIGPKLEPAGLLRIIKLLERRTPLASWAQAVTALKASSPGIENLAEGGWESFAKRIFKETAEGLVADCDPKLAQNFPSAEDVTNNKIAEMWELFGALTNKPCAVLRGENSDLLSEATVARMSEMHPGLITVTVKDRGHVPFLDEPECVEAIRVVAARCD
jgi:pimeloyl-ACP methyl ester carboxylesterase